MHASKKGGEHSSAAASQPSDHRRKNLPNEPCGFIFPLPPSIHKLRMCLVVLMMRPSLGYFSTNHPFLPYGDQEGLINHTYWSPLFKRLLFSDRKHGAMQQKVYTPI